MNHFLRNAGLLACSFFIISTLKAQDSVKVRAHASYNDVSGFHKFFFGENYRKEWAAETTLPVIRISEIKGGLKALERGGGNQTKSLRLVDKKGQEWVLRSIEKFPEVLLPEAIRNTFAKDWVNDAMSAQHPYSALIVPVLADAEGIYHSNPIIGKVLPDSALGKFSADFENQLCLLEEREPIGKSDNSIKMLSSLREDNDNQVADEAFLRAIMLDLVMGDWDRHLDQWRWRDEKDGSGKLYMPVPRDRDQVFYVNQGIVPRSVSRRWFFPFMQGFKGEIENVNTQLWETRVLVTRVLNQISYEKWMSVTNDFISRIPDSVLERALKRLPESSYNIRHKELLANMQQRRNSFPAEMDKFYRFLNKIVDVELSDKNEKIVLTDTAERKLNVRIYKISKSGELEQQLFFKALDPEITREVRIFTAKGNDQVLVDNKTSPVKVRVVGGQGDKNYSAAASNRKVKVYDLKSNDHFTDPEHRFSKHLSNDSSNVSIVQTNRYNIPQPLVTGGYNKDDGLLLGLGIKYTYQGFRKVPYAGVQSFTAGHSFSTKAFRLRYSGEWLRAIGSADIVVQATAYAPNNTMNFYGRGNETPFDKSGDFVTYYRTRFNLYQVDPTIRWRHPGGISIESGLSFQYYHYNPGDNTGRFINSNADIGSYDSTTLDREKVHGGVTFNFTQDRRGNKLLPVSGIYMNFKAAAYKGLNSFSESFVRILPEFSFYQKISRDSVLVLANRTGGGITFGDATFYQSVFLGGQGNLLGYRQFRFAGEQMLYNNLELRLRFGQLANYILPGEIGMNAFYDIGRVWVKNEDSSKWHQGVGAGLYFAPARYLVAQFIEGYSTEGWYPYIRLSMRF
ncbi:BamA/TamA family outer membrane protein [Pedobacter sp. HMF7647]|uniref:BamA/TamA family outer membrane protein n=1 Tax=Hufsiella arboris TaxID=2695275 RepID=A0A7K1Y7R4_9SPHI|nr:BamA/TamA family outer membrane protein [Hufsiella arboris]MXV50622.1 BamA/TamA family outer membrane protein [Hufsiella arboris]